MILKRIVIAKREEIRERKASLPAETLERRIHEAAATRDFAGALRRKPGEPVKLIGEFKRASPSRGTIRDDLGPADVARQYEGAGAAAMSVLTDGPFFSGSLDDLRAAREAVNLPLLRKDFILDEYQLLESRAAGADAVLLIAAALSDEELAGLQASAAALGLDALVEVHNEEELHRTLAIAPRLVGINNRNLQTFEVNLATTCKLRPMISLGIIVISESGIHSREHALKLEKAGVDAMLVGEFLMRQPNPGDAARELLGEK